MSYTPEDKEWASITACVEGDDEVISDDEGLYSAGRLRLPKPSVPKPSVPKPVTVVKPITKPATTPTTKPVPKATLTDKTKAVLNDLKKAGIDYASQAIKQELADAAKDLLENNPLAPAWKEFFQREKVYMQVILINNTDSNIVRGAVELSPGANIDPKLACPDTIDAGQRAVFAIVAPGAISGGILFTIKSAQPVTFSAAMDLDKGLVGTAFSGSVKDGLSKAVVNGIRGEGSGFIVAGIVNQQAKLVTYIVDKK